MLNQLQGYDKTQCFVLYDNVHVHVLYLALNGTFTCMVHVGIHYHQPRATN